MIIDKNKLGKLIKDVHLITHKNSYGKEILEHEVEIFLKFVI